MTQLDLFGEVAAQQDRLERLKSLQRELELDCCTGVELDPADYPALNGYAFPDPVRCGRCGQVVNAIQIEGVGGHDSGWLGCAGVDYDAPPFRQLTLEQLVDRHDNKHHPMCAGCGHPWGLHHEGWVGMSLPEESHCLALCACRGYVAP